MARSSSHCVNRKCRARSDGPPVTSTRHVLASETIGENCGEWLELVLEHRAKWRIDAGDDPAFIFATPQKIIFRATLAISEETDVDHLMV